MRGLDARAAAMIRIDAMWLAVHPTDMRAGADRLLAKVVQVFGVAQAAPRLPLCQRALNAHHLVFGFFKSDPLAGRQRPLSDSNRQTWTDTERANFIWSNALSSMPATTRCMKSLCLLAGWPTA
jgi:hypothetical protein